MKTSVVAITVAVSWFIEYRDKSTVEPLRLRATQQSTIRRRVWQADGYVARLARRAPAAEASFLY
jgi:hypothetical protein